MTPRGAPWRDALAQPRSSLASVGAHNVMHKRHRGGGASGTGLDALGRRTKVAINFLRPELLLATARPLRLCFDHGLYPGYTSRRYMWLRW